MSKNCRIFLAGHRGLVGSAILRRLESLGYANLIVRSHQELDLTVQAEVDRFFAEARPDWVILAAAKVGGILANATYPADFIRDNLLMQTHVIDAAWRCGVGKFLFLGSSCIYPALAPQPIKEEYLLAGPLESTNEAYAMAKIAGLKMCQAYYKQYGFQALSLMPTNLYGPNDNFDLQSSHVLPALIRKFHEAKANHYAEVPIWGTGKPRREFLHVDDLADAALFLLEHPWEEIFKMAPDGILNVGVGEDMEIGELAQLVRDIVGASCKLVFDHGKPDGTLRKLLDVSRLHALGWKAKIPLAIGIRSTYEWYCQTVNGDVIG
jgi:GDP-L-fucose synthase